MMDVDICIIGGGLCGVGIASYLKKTLRDKTFALIEKRNDLGGTWDLCRYPGIRTDSDMYTYGYHFRAFHGSKIFREGSEIVDYIRSTARENNLAEIMLLGHVVRRAEWQTGCARWTLHAENITTSEPCRITSRYVVFCTGYYAYDSGYTPEFANVDKFKGRIVHPQSWPSDIDYTDKEIVIVGSGATSVTLAPVLAKTARHVTVLQRSPSYVVPMSATSPTASFLFALLPATLAYPLVRCLFILYQIITTALLTYYSSLGKKVILRKTALALGDEAPAHMKHFTPTYNPWDQRLCLCPNGDLFEAIKAKKVSYVTDEIHSFTSDGLLLQSMKNSGDDTRQFLPADLVVTATGFNLQALGGVEVVVDGEVKPPAECFTYKGVMLCGVPNFFWCMGYNGASLTLKVEPTAVYISRMLNFMTLNRYTSIEPTIPPVSCRQSSQRVFSSTSTYVKRNGHLFPQQGTCTPWRYIQDYVSDMWPLKFEPIVKNDKNLKFS